MPDNTFPNVKLVQGLLQCIDSLNIETDHLENSKLGQVVHYYAEDITNITAVKPLAKKIMEKWSRIIFNINR